MSEYTQRYQHVSHRELYDAVHAGDPQQIDNLASQWSSLRDTLDNLARDLGADLEKLAPAWTGDAAREFHDRLSLVVRYSSDLAEGTADVRQALSLMAGQLRTAQKTAESPEATDDHDKAVDGATKGLVLGVPGMIVGGILGHQQDKAEQEKAHQRMVQVVADLAAGYEVASYGRVVDPPAPPPRLPGEADRNGATTKAGPSVGSPASAPGTGIAGPGGGATVSTPSSPAHGPTTGSGDTGTGGNGSGTTTTPVTGGGLVGSGTSLAGAEPLTGGALPGGAGLAGAGGGASGGGSGMAFGAAAGIAAGGVLGTGALASSGRASAPTPVRPATGATGMENRSAAGTGRLASGQLGSANGGRPGTGGTPANRAATAGGTGRNGVIGGRGQHGEDESDERLTWLTEDEVVWHDGADTAPPVLGGDR